MRTIYKQLLAQGINTLVVYGKSQILTCYAQGQDLYIWFLTDSNVNSKETTHYQFLIIEENCSIPGKEYKYLNTIEQNGLIGHVFYKKGNE